MGIASTHRIIGLKIFNFKMVMLLQFAFRKKVNLLNLHNGHIVC